MKDYISPKFNRSVETPEGPAFYSEGSYPFAITKTGTAYNAHTGRPTKPIQDKSCRMTKLRIVLYKRVDGKQTRAQRFYSYEKLFAEAFMPDHRAGLNYLWDTKANERIYCFPLTHEIALARNLMCGTRSGAFMKKGATSTLRVYVLDTQELTILETTATEFYTNYVIQQNAAVNKSDKSPDDKRRAAQCMNEACRAGTCMYGRFYIWPNGNDSLKVGDVLELSRKEIMGIKGRTRVLRVDVRNKKLSIVVVDEHRKKRRAGVYNVSGKETETFTLGTSFFPSDLNDLSIKVVDTFPTGILRPQSNGVDLFDFRWNLRQVA